jgi:hypothetical protein
MRREGWWVKSGKRYLRARHGRCSCLRRTRRRGEWRSLAGWKRRSPLSSVPEQLWRWGEQRPAMRRCERNAWLSMWWLCSGQHKHCRVQRLAEEKGGGCSTTGKGERMDGYSISQKRHPRGTNPTGGVSRPTQHACGIRPSMPAGVCSAVPGHHLPSPPAISPTKPHIQK